MIDVWHILIIPVLLVGAIMIRTERRRAINRNLETLQRDGFVISEIHDGAHPVVVADHMNRRMALVTGKGYEFLPVDGADQPKPARDCTGQAKPARDDQIQCHVNSQQRFTA